MSELELVLADNTEKLWKESCLMVLWRGIGGVKDTRTYEENDELQGYVMTLQEFERMLKREAEKGNVEISETEIKTDLKFDI